MTTLPATDRAQDPVLARMGALLGLPIATEADVFDLVRLGLGAMAWTRLAAAAPLPKDLFVGADYARLMATLGRRFSPAETDLILRAVRLFAQAHEALGSHEAAREWLCSPLEFRPGAGAVAPWTLATTEAGARLCERALGLGTTLASAMQPPAAAPGVAAPARNDAGMTDAELAWAAALDEQRAAGLAPTDANASVGADVDIAAVLGEVAVDPHELDWAAALAEQAAAGQEDGSVASTDDPDAILAEAARSPDA